MTRIATLACLLLATALPAAAETIKLRLQDPTALKKLELRCVSDEKEVWRLPVLGRFPGIRQRFRDENGASQGRVPPLL